MARGPALLMEKTGLKDNNIRAVLSRLSKQGKIVRVGRGHYVRGMKSLQCCVMAL